MFIVLRAWAKEKNLSPDRNRTYGLLLICIFITDAQPLSYERLLVS